MSAMSRIRSRLSGVTFTLRCDAIRNAACLTHIALHQVPTLTHQSRTRARTSARPADDSLAARTIVVAPGRSEKVRMMFNGKDRRRLQNLRRVAVLTTITTRQGSHTSVLSQDILLFPAHSGSAGHKVA
jgi:hypothetical protein